VVIRVLDLTGRVVDELQLGKQEEGVHLADWDAGSLNPGTYCIQMNNATKVYKKVFIVR
jgi:flagellar hook assembly protein FlgD